jgi:hypothetical protein
VKSPAQAAQNWATAMAQAGAKYTAGVQSSGKNPNALAAAAVNNYAAGTANAVASGKFVAANQAVPPGAWQAGCVQKGAQRLASGAQAAQPKVNAMMSQLLPAIQNAVGQLPARGPKGTNNGRSAAFADAMHAWGAARK